jgi:ribosomal protein S14
METDTEMEMEMESSSNCKTSMRKKRDEKKCQVCGRAKTVYNYYGAVCCGGSICH